MTHRRFILFILFVVGVFRCPPAGFVSDNIRVDDVLRIMMVLGAVSILGVYMFKVNIWAGLFMFAAGFSHIYPVYTPHSIMTLFLVVLGGIVYLKIATDFEHDYHGVFDIMCIICIVHVVLLGFNFFGYRADIYGALQQTHVDTVGLMGNPNDAAAAIAICLPAFFRRYFFYLLPVPFVGLLMAHSTGGLAGAVLACLIFVVMSDYRNKWRFVAAVIASAVLFLIFVDRPSVGIGQRLDIWRESLLNHFTGHRTTGIPNQVFFGLGLGNWKFFIKGIGLINGIYWTRIHNTFIQAFVEIGVPFIVILIGYSINVIRRITINSKIHMAALGSIVMVCMANSAFQMNLVNALLMVLWLATAEYTLKRNFKNDCSST